jgi:hypothetical protein
VADRPDDGWTAFPSIDYENGMDALVEVYRPGMSLLDWFAGQALPRFAARVIASSEIAKLAYDIADAMIAEKRRREKEML